MGKMFNKFTARKQSFLALLFSLAKKVTKNALAAEPSQRPTSSLQAKQKETCCRWQLQTTFCFKRLTSLCGYPTALGKAAETETPKG